MVFEILNRWDRTVIYTGEGETLAAVLTQAVSSGADLDGASLSGASLRNADLRGASLSGADLYGASLRNANLGNANLGNANLSGADLRGADLRGASLSNANLSGALGLHTFRICAEGAIIGWKMTAEGKILCLEIPAGASRLNRPGSRKCRAEFAKVIAVYTAERVLLTGYTGKLTSKHSNSFNYVVGDVVRPERFDPDIREECSNGIHFFITFEEARDY